MLQGGGEVRLASLTGTHLTPLTPDSPEEPPLLPLPPLPLPPTLPAAAASLAGARQADFDATTALLIEFLDESLAASTRRSRAEKE